VYSREMPIPDVSDFEIARHVQSAFLPKTCRSCEGVDVAARHVMSEGIGGDLYDFVSGPGNRYSIVIGDVVGHGLFSALVMSLIFGAVHTAGAKAAAPAEIARLVNELLCDLNEELRSLILMCSLFYGTVRPEQHRMIYASAGHPSPLMWFDSRQTGQLEATCPMLGVTRKINFSESSLSLKGVRRIIFYTDGVTEARDEKGRFFGTAGIVNVLSSCEKLNPDASLDRLFKAVMAWVQGTARDDMTAILADFVAERAEHTDVEVHDGAKSPSKPRSDRRVGRTPSMAS